jgi:hypothetical protein
VRWGKDGECLIDWAVGHVRRDTGEARGSQGASGDRGNRSACGLLKILSHHAFASHDEHSVGAEKGREAWSWSAAEVGG